MLPMLLPALPKTFVRNVCTEVRSAPELSAFSLKFDHTVLVRSVRLAWKGKDLESQNYN
jgi:hypothetical protein